MEFKTVATVVLTAIGSSFVSSQYVGYKYEAREASALQFAVLLERLDSIDANIDNLSTKFDQLDSKFDRLVFKFDHLETRFDQLETKLDTNTARLETKLDSLIAATKSTN